MNYRISSFWSRIAAFVVDMILLSILGMILGIFFGDYFVLLNTNGVLIGFIISLIYFSIMNSHIGNGQTLGKLLLKVKVIDKNGNPLSFQKAFFRALVLTAPYFLVNYRIPGVAEESILYLVKVQIMFYALIGLTAVYIFNKFTRQSIHDLTVNSFVVDQTQYGSEHEIQSIKPYVFYIFGGLVAILMLITIYNFSKPKQDKLADVRTVQKELLKIDGVLNAATTRNTHTFRGQGETSVTESLTGVLYVVKAPKDYQEFQNSPLVKKAVKILVENYPESENLDVINIQLVRAYNLGIWKSSFSYNDSKSPFEWLETFELTNSEIVEKKAQLEAEKEEIVNKEFANLELHKVNDNHTIYYNSEMPSEDVKILETAISKLKGYFPVNQVIDIVFLNKKGTYYLKLFVKRNYWRDKGAINRIKSAATYIKDSGIDNEIKIVFVDSNDYSEKEVK